MVQSNMSEQDSISEKHGPMWDHDDLSMATWVEDRLRWCVKKDPNYASLASEGFILDTLARIERRLPHIALHVRNGCRSTAEPIALVLGRVQ